MSYTNDSRTEIKDNQSFFFFVSQAHKIASAVYLVTELLDRDEPLKWTLRSRVLDVVSDISALFARDTGTKHGLNEAKRTIEQVLLLLETASRARLVSTMNRDIILEEVQRFAKELEERFSSTHLITIERLREALDTKHEMPRLPAVETPDVNKGHFQGHVPKPTTRSTQPSRPASIKDKKTAPAPKPKKTEQNNGDRRENIVALLKRKGPSSVKDITAEIGGVSEKTIQRELADMITSGVVKKEGERRWTVYFL